MCSRTLSRRGRNGLDQTEAVMQPATDANGNKRIQAGTRARLHEYWRLFADTFPAQPFLSGAQLGALDLLAAVVSRWSGARAHLATERPAFHALMQRIEADPRLADIFERHWPPK